MLNSAANVLRTLEFLVERDEVGVSEIGRHLGVTVATAHRLVTTMVEIGWAEQNPGTRKYRPSSKVLTLAQKMRARVTPAARIHLHLVELMQTVHEAVHFGVLEGQAVRFVDKASSEQPFAIEIRIGSTLPLYVSPLGLVLAAFADSLDLKSVLKSGNVSMFDVTPPKLEEFQRELASVRSTGVAEGDCLFLPGVYSVAAPVRAADGNVIAAIDISGPKSRFGTTRHDLRAEVERCAERIAEELHQLGVNHLH